MWRPTWWLAGAALVVVVQSLSHVWLFVTPWTAACQASLSFTTSQNLLKLMSIESVMPANCLILCHPLLLLPLSNTLAIWQNLSRELRFNPRVVLSACISQQIKPSLISLNISFCSFHTDHTLRSISTFFVPSEHNAIDSVNTFQIIATFFSEPKVRLLWKNLGCSYNFSTDLQ